VIRASTGAVAALVAGVAGLTTSVARAEPNPDGARAEALFEEAKVLRGAGRITEACAHFEESRRLDEGIGVTLYLADCYEHAGDLPRAVTEFRRAEALASVHGDKRAAVARRRAEAVEALSPPRRSPATSPTRPTAERAPVLAWGGASEATASPSGEDAVARSRATRRWIGIGIGGAGVVGIGVGALFGAIALSKLSQSNDGPCGADNHCTPAGLELRHESGTAATGSTIGFVAGAAALAGGIAIYLTAPGGGETMTVAPTATAGGGGAVLAGRF
jgi:serine/threonine-protein kinase